MRYGKRTGMKNGVNSRGFSSRPSVLRSEDGMALVLVLILSVISLAFMASLVYMVTTVTQMSGAHKRYETALECGKAGVNVARQFVNARGNPNITGINFIQTTAAVCMTAKLNSPTASWAGCPANATSVTITPADNTSYDMTFDIGSSPVYRGYAKIVDTINGNSGANTGLVITGVVNTGNIATMNNPYLYTVEVLCENLANPRERARFSVLHEY